MSDSLLNSSRLRRQKLGNPAAFRTHSEGLMSLNSLFRDFQGSFRHLSGIIERLENTYVIALQMGSRAR